MQNLPRHIFVLTGNLILLPLARSSAVWGGLVPDRDARILAYPSSLKNRELRRPQFKAQALFSKRTTNPSGWEESRLPSIHAAPGSRHSQRRQLVTIQ
ncbi:hypothetical protein C8R47DRAFT_736480 [Mycena vitilis]|nr:hypothetical protein C8R47DRAFT_736480 [Mycena vitilis]